MPKPFGKRLHHGRSLTKGLRLTFALWVAAIPAFLLCRSAAKPTLSESPFFGLAALFFMIFYGAVFRSWFLKRPTPRPPGSSNVGRAIGFTILSIFIAVPAGFVSGVLYEPALKLANGMGSTGSAVVEHAMVDKVNSDWYLDCPYWENDYRWKIQNTGDLPKDLTPGSLAAVKLRKGLLGARWIESIEYTVLR